MLFQLFSYLSELADFTQTLSYRRLWFLFYNIIYMAQIFSRLPNFPLLAIYANRPSQTSRAKITYRSGNPSVSQPRSGWIQKVKPMFSGSLSFDFFFVAAVGRCFFSFVTCKHALFLWECNFANVKWKLIRHMQSKTVKRIGFQAFWRFCIQIAKHRTLIIFVISI